MTIPSNWEDVLQESQIEAARTVADDLAATECEVSAEPPVESVEPPGEPEEKIVVTSHSIRLAYHDLYTATVNAFSATESLAQIQATLKVAEIGPWPGSNETERKAAQARATFDIRENLVAAESNQRQADCMVALAKIHVDELRMHLRLMEWSQREVELEKYANDAVDMGFWRGD